MRTLSRCGSRRPFVNTLTSPAAGRRRGAAFLALFLLGCADSAVAPQHPVAMSNASGMYWALTLDKQAVTLSTAPPCDTVRLTATARDGHGAPLAGLGAALFHTLDSTRLSIGANGLVRALKAGTGIKVIAELAAGNVRHADTLLLDVTTDAASRRLASFSIQPVPPDSAIWPVAAIEQAAGFIKFVAGRAADAGGNPISGLRVAYASSDTTIARIDPSTGRLTGVRPGRVMLSANATSCGVTMADSVPYTITMPVYTLVNVKPNPARTGRTTSTIFEPHDITIRPGGVVLWWNTSEAPFDVTFDDPAAVAVSTIPCGTVLLCLDPEPMVGGDIPATMEKRSRRFPVAGVYPYRSKLTGASGRVIVTGDASDP